MMTDFVTVTLSLVLFLSLLLIVFWKHSTKSVGSVVLCRQGSERSLFINSKLKNKQKWLGSLWSPHKAYTQFLSFCKFFLLSLSSFAPLPIVFFCPVGSSCRLYCCLGNWRFRYLLASILLVDLDLQMVRQVLIRVGPARSHGSQVTPLW